LFNLSDKVAVITGGASGIGRAMSTLFGRQGAHVVVLDLDGAAAERTAADIARAGGSADGAACDVSDASAVRATFESIVERSHRIDILVNNAGVAHVGNIERTTEEELDRLYRVNVKGVFLCTQAAVPVMVGQGGGVIVNMASIVAFIGVADRFAYSMTKGAVLTMTKSVAIDYLKHRVRCNCICPARIHTPFVDGFVKKNYPGREDEVLRELSAYQPMGRMGTPEEVAFLALYLCSDEASFVTGQAFPLDGGVLNQ
jgi:NAD(P)-dependent dehydrogenase (short-subunit alcohol dehydrogenase family)